MHGLALWKRCLYWWGSAMANKLSHVCVGYKVSGSNCKYKVNHFLSLSCQKYRSITWNWVKQSFIYNKNALQKNQGRQDFHQNRSMKSKFVNLNLNKRNLICRISNFNCRLLMDTEVKSYLPTRQWFQKNMSEFHITHVEELFENSDR